MFSRYKWAPFGTLVDTSLPNWVATEETVEMVNPMSLTNWGIVTVDTSWLGLFSTGCSHYGRDEMGLAMVVLLATLLLGQRRRPIPENTVSQ